MIKILFTPGAVAANTNIPITTLFNTNNKTSLSTTDNTISLNIAGLWDVKGNLIFVSTETTPVSIQLFADGVAVEGAISTITPTVGGTYTLNIDDVVRTVKSPLFDFAKLSFQVSTAITITSGDAIIEYRR